MWWQFGCNDELTPKFIDKLGWSVSIKSMQGMLFAWICVGLFVNWEKSFEDVNEETFHPSVVLISLHH